MNAPALKSLAVLDTFIQPNGEENAMADDLELEHTPSRDYDEPGPPKPRPAPLLREVIESSVEKHRGPETDIMFASPATVAANGLLKPTFVSHGGYQVFVFERGTAGLVPHRICAVVPDGTTEFTRALIFFHPLPTKKAGYEDEQYQAQTGGWHKIYRYCDQQGIALAASKRRMVLIFPIFNLASAGTCGDFPANWKTLVEFMMKAIRNRRFPHLAKDKGPEIADVITASYSAGVKYMSTFLTKATNVKGLLREVWDYDGRFSTENLLSEGLGSFGAKLLRYDQRPVKLTDVEKDAKAGKGIHIPEPRWKDLPGDKTSFLDLPLDTHDVEIVGKGSLTVHGAFPRFIMFHSLMDSSIGK